MRVFVRLYVPIHEHMRLYVLKCACVRLLAGLIRLDAIDTHHVRLDASKHALMHSTTHRCANTRLDVSKHS